MQHRWTAWPWTALAECFVASLSQGVMRVFGVTCALLTPLGPSLFTFPVDVLPWTALMVCVRA
jgi:hypothetical protein